MDEKVAVTFPPKKRQRKPVTDDDDTTASADTDKVNSYDVITVLQADSQIPF